MIWLIFGVLAVVTAIINIVFAAINKERKIFMFFSLSFTALTVLAFYINTAQRVLVGELIGLVDIFSIMSSRLLYLSIISIIINGIYLLKKN